MASLKPDPSRISGGADAFGPGAPRVSLRFCVSNGFMEGFGNSSPPFADDSPQRPLGGRCGTAAGILGPQGVYVGQAVVS